MRPFRPLCMLLVLLGASVSGTALSAPAGESTLPQCTSTRATVSGVYYRFAKRPARRVVRITVSDDSIEFADNFDIEQTDESEIIWDNSERFSLERNRDGAVIYAIPGGYRAFLIYQSEQRNYPLRMASLGGSRELATLEARVDKALKAANPDCVFQTPLFRKDELAGMRNLPSLEALSRAHAIQLLNARSDHGERIRRAVEARDGRLPRSAVFQLSKQLRQMMLVDLGYNPWRRHEGDPMAKFADDPEIQALLADTAASR